MQMIKTMLIATAALSAIVLSSAANSAIVIDIMQNGADVVTNASGSLDTSALTSILLKTGSARIQGTTVAANSSGSVTLNGYGVFSGPLSIGPGTTSFSATSHSGTDFAFSYLPVNANGPVAYLPTSYVSGTSFTSGAVYAGQTLSTLGLTAGQYLYTYETQTVTINVAGVPEPVTWAMMLVGFAAIGVAIRRRLPVTPGAVYAG